MLAQQKYLAIVGLVAIPLVLAPCANADDQSFVSAIREGGIRAGIMSDASLVTMGHMICDRLRGGMSVSDFSGGMMVDQQGIAAAAQREICPDTLH